jgi:hypothetical protein
MLLIDLINSKRGGKNEDRGGKWPEIQIVIVTHIWIVSPNLVWDIEWMGIPGKLREQTHDDKEMTKKKVVRRHRLYAVGRRHSKASSKRLQVLTKSRSRSLRINCLCRNNLARKVKMLTTANAVTARLVALDAK